jgi:hypothetical protein
MKHIIILLVIILAVSFEFNLPSKLRIEKFFGGSSKSNIDNLDELLKNNYKPIMWVYNPYEYNATEWENFGSRRLKQPTPGLIEACLDSIYNKSNRDFTVIIFNQDDLHRLLPDFFKNKDFVIKIKNDYVLMNFIKYALLVKYGGYWIPADTILIKSIKDTIPIYKNNKFITLTKNNMNFIDFDGLSDDYIACQKNNPIAVECQNFILKNIDTFQNSILFKNAVNKYFNSILPNYSNNITPIYIGLLKDNNNVFLNESMLFSQMNTQINPDVYFIPLFYNTIRLRPKLNWIERMNKKDILKSNMQLSKWLLL